MTGVTDPSRRPSIGSNFLPLRVRHLKRPPRMGAFSLLCVLLLTFNTERYENSRFVSREAMSLEALPRNLGFGPIKRLAFPDRCDSRLPGGSADGSGLLLAHGRAVR